MQSIRSISQPGYGPQFPSAEEVPFAHYRNRYKGQSCHVVGRGLTDFPYEQLGELSEPVFFINDAVSLEKFARGETFFFAHDPQPLVWLNGAVRSTAVLPIDGKLFVGAENQSFDHAGKLVFYHWRQNDARELLRLDRHQIALRKQLYQHSGTIHSALHFIWYCGFTSVTLVGCDGIGSAGYDPRLDNRSNSTAVDYTGIRRTQDLLIEFFGFQAEYRGTPG